MSKLTEEEIEEIIESIKNLDIVKGVTLITPDMSIEDIQELAEKMEHEERTDN